MNISRPKRLLLLLLAVVAFGGVVGSYYFNHQYKVLKGNPTAAAKKETDKLVAKLGQLIQLPTGETPTVATISDKSKLTDQTFFKTAANGDKLFVYNAAMLAILYRPDTNKIINVAPITINQPSTTASAGTNTTAGAATLRIAYYNGTSLTGLTTTVSKSVMTAYPTWETATVARAKKEYSQTIVVDVSGRHGAEAQTLATFLSGTVGGLPTGEVAPEADILVIAAK